MEKDSKKIKQKLSPKRIHQDTNYLLDHNQEQPERSPSSEGANLPVQKSLPAVLDIFPLRERPLFPGIVYPLVISNKEHWQFIQNIAGSNSPYVGLVLIDPQKDQGSKKSRSHTQLSKVGVIGKIMQTSIVDGQHLHVIVSTLARFEVKEYWSMGATFKASVDYWQDSIAASLGEEMKAYSLSLISCIKELIASGALFKEELGLMLSKNDLEGPFKLASHAALLTSSEASQLQDLLETKAPLDYMEKALILLKAELDMAKTQGKINQRVEQKLGKQQKEFFLRQQLKEINKELGITQDEKQSDAHLFRQKAQNLTFTQAAKERFDEEIKKLETLSAESPEYSITRNYLDWITSLPWGQKSEDHFDLVQGRKILDEDHWGMNEVKERLLEFMAIGLVKGNIKGQVLLLVGPPGVGKTSIAKSLARALNRPFYRFALGGMRDEAEIKGHRRTYIGAMPGKFLHGLKSAKVQNPVILLDEIDKVGGSYRGDPASALLEVLDPEQNKDFVDHFLDLPFDLSDILFVCTANQLDTIAPPLLDRMEIITLSGHTTGEKVQIAKQYLIPKTVKSFNAPQNWNSLLDDEGLSFMIDNYARESGVRSLEKHIQKIMRKILAKKIERQEKLEEISTLNQSQIKELLGPFRFIDEKLFDNHTPGVVTGLAYTNHGGATLNIETKAIASTAPGLKFTGQLGDVMKESVDLAYSYVRSHLGEFFNNNSVHLHVPAGATPKDGPSAGITMALAMHSLASNRPVKDHLAMTGELTLTGLVLPIGGVKEKILAAKRAKIKDIILPKSNQEDFELLEAEIKKDIKAHFVNHFDEVLALAY